MVKISSTFVFVNILKYKNKEGRVVCNIYTKTWNTNHKVYDSRVSFPAIAVCNIKTTARLNNDEFVENKKTGCGKFKNRHDFHT